MIIDQHNLITLTYNPATSPLHLYIDSLVSSSATLLNCRVPLDARSDELVAL